MTHALIAAKSGWGKGWLSQYWIEDNLSNYDYVVVLDRRDEFRGLVKQGFARWMALGPREQPVSPSGWVDVIRENRRLVLARYKLGADDWKEAVARVVHGALESDLEVLVVIDEAHKVAPQRDSYPDPLEDLATEGRGRVASIWITQRLAKLDTTPVSEMMIYVLGGFQSDSDLKKIKKNVGYPKDIHKANGGEVRRLPEDLHAENAGPVALRKFTEEGSTIGSEWIYSDDDGDRRRLNSRELSMKSTHYGPESLDLSTPG